MRNRREFLQIGVTATAWPFVARAAQAAGLDASPAMIPLFAVVYDARRPDSVAFARRSEALGVRPLAIDDDGDMTHLWYEQLYRQWQQGPAAIAGLTAHGPMFCFAELARDVRMRMVFRAEHRAGGDGVAHRFSGPVSMLSCALGACRREASLGTAMAEVVSSCPSGRTEIASADFGRFPGSPAEDALYTWVIAPAVKG